MTPARQCYVSKYLVMKTMQRLPRRGSLFLAMIVLLVLLLGSANGQTVPGQNAPLKIGYLMDSLKVERWQTDLATFQKRAKELGAEVLVETAEGDDDLQLQQSQKLIDAGAKVLVLVPHDTDKAARIVNAAKARHVPVLCYERLVRNSDVDFFVGTNAEVIGELQSSTLARLAPKGNYVLIGGSQTDSNAKVLREGQMRALQASVDRGDIKIVERRLGKRLGSGRGLRHHVQSDRFHERQYRGCSRFQ